MDDNKSMGKLLVVDDDTLERQLMVRLLRKKFEFDVVEADNGKSALEILSSEKGRNVKAVLMDLNMPVMGGMEALSIIRQRHPTMPVIIITGTIDVSNTVKAIKLGAVDFIGKPYDAERVLVSVTNAIKISVLTRELSVIKSEVDGAFKFEQIIGYDKGLSAQINLGRKACTSDIPVLITGETGTGKELFARAIHGQSHRSGRPFIAVNCGAIPSQLVESTLFGHEKGAFTGATQKFVGKFREAEGGTIFLDEVGDLPWDVQVKLLRVLQQREVEPVGASKSVPVNVRVISATNKTLEESVKSGNFREDLLFRLNVLKIHIPPLRERHSDIEEIAENFVDRFCNEASIIPKKIDKKVLKMMKQFAWPGNVRQLENAINRAIVIAEHDILYEQDFHDIFKTDSKIVEKVRDNHTGTQINLIHKNGRIKTLENLEYEAIQCAIKISDGNITKAAASLGIAKSTLYKKLKACKQPLRCK